MWEAPEDNIEESLRGQLRTACRGCPVQIYCMGGIWPHTYVGCSQCGTIMDEATPETPRVVRCGMSTLQNWWSMHPYWNRRTGKLCNCTNTPHADPGHKGCDRIVET